MSCIKKDNGIIIFHSRSILQKIINYIQRFFNSTISRRTNSNPKIGKKVLKGKNSPDFYQHLSQQRANIQGTTIPPRGSSRTRSGIVVKEFDRGVGQVCFAARCRRRRQGTATREWPSTQARLPAIPSFRIHGPVLHALLLAIRLPAHIPPRPRLIFSSNTPSAFAPASMSCKFSICDPAISNDVGFSTRRSRNVELAKG